MLGERIERRTGDRAERLARLALDYDRWGLAPEAEVARLRRRRLVDALREELWPAGSPGDLAAGEAGGGRA